MEEEDHQQESTFSHQENLLSSDTSLHDTHFFKLSNIKNTVSSNSTISTPEKGISLVKTRNSFNLDNSRQYIHSICFDLWRNILFLIVEEESIVSNVSSLERSIWVFDLETNKICYKSQKVSTSVSCIFFAESDRLCIVQGNLVCLRTQSKGRFMLNAIHQEIHSKDDIVILELDMSEANLLLNIIQSNESTSLGSHKLVEQLEKQINQEQSSEPNKWKSCFIELDYSTLHTIMNRICTQEKDPVEIVFAIIEQLESFQVLKSNNLRFFDPMVSELKRLQTFKNWPHPEYRMAVPSKLAESGFFHTPAETHPDRCTCFYCLIALVSWEPTDEGWTEHKRHSPTCNFILGKPTGNIPISLSLRSSPGIKHSEDKLIEFISSDLQNRIIVTASPEGEISVFDSSIQLTKLFSFNCFIFNDESKFEFDFSSSTHSLTNYLNRENSHEFYETISPQTSDAEEEDQEYSSDEENIYGNGLAYFDSLLKKPSFSSFTDGMEVKLEGVDQEMSDFHENELEEESLKKSEEKKEFHFEDGLLGDLTVLESILTNRPSVKGYILVALIPKDSAIQKTLFSVYFCSKSEELIQFLVFPEAGITCLQMFSSTDSPVVFAYGSNKIFLFHWDSKLKKLNSVPLVKNTVPESLSKVIDVTLEKNYFFLGLTEKGSLIVFDHSTLQIYQTFHFSFPLRDIVFSKHSSQICLASKNGFSFFSLNLLSPQGKLLQDNNQSTFIQQPITSTHLSYLQNLFKGHLMNFKADTSALTDVSHINSKEVWKFSNELFKDEEEECTLIALLPFHTILCKIELSLKFEHSADFLPKNSPIYELSIEATQDSKTISIFNNNLEKLLINSNNIEDKLIEIPTFKIITGATSNLKFLLRYSNPQNSTINRLESISISIYGKKYDHQTSSDILTLIDAKEYISLLVHKSANIHVSPLLRTQILDILQSILSYEPKKIGQILPWKEFIETNFFHSDFQVIIPATQFIKSLIELSFNSRELFINASIELLSIIDSASTYYGVSSWFTLFQNILDREQNVQKLVEHLLSKLEQLGKMAYALRNPYYKLLQTYFKIDDLPLEINPFKFRDNYLAGIPLEFSIAEKGTDVAYNAQCHQVYFQSIMGTHWITLDFGNPTLLTEIFFEMNPQVSQLNLDIWTKSECEDGKRILLAYNLSSKTLHLSQLSYVCRFLKVSVYGSEYYAAALDLFGIRGIPCYYTDYTLIEEEFLRNLIENEEKTKKNHEKEIQNLGDKLKSILSKFYISHNLDIQNYLELYSENVSNICKKSRFIQSQLLQSNQTLARLKNLLRDKDSGSEEPSSTFIYKPSIDDSSSNNQLDKFVSLIDLLSTLISKIFIFFTGVKEVSITSEQIKELFIYHVVYGNKKELRYQIRILISFISIENFDQIIWDLFIQFFHSPPKQLIDQFPRAEIFDYFCDIIFQRKASFFSPLFDSLLNNISNIYLLEWSLLLLHKSFYNPYQTNFDESIFKTVNPVAILFKLLSLLSCSFSNSVMENHTLEVYLVTLRLFFQFAKCFRNLTRDVIKNFEEFIPFIEFNLNHMPSNLVIPFLSNFITTSDATTLPLLRELFTQILLQNQSPNLIKLILTDSNFTLEFNSSQRLQLINHLLKILSHDTFSDLNFNLVLRILSNLKAIELLDLQENNKQKLFELIHLGLTHSHPELIREDLLHLLTVLGERVTPILFSNLVYMFSEVKLLTEWNKRLFLSLIHFCIKNSLNFPTLIASFKVDDIFKLFLTIPNNHIFKHLISSVNIIGDEEIICGLFELLNLCFNEPEIRDHVINSSYHQTLFDFVKNLTIPHKNIISQIWNLLISISKNFECSLLLLNISYNVIKSGTRNHSILNLIESILTTPKLVSHFIDCGAFQFCFQQFFQPSLFASNIRDPIFWNTAIEFYKTSAFPFAHIDTFDFTSDCLVEVEKEKTKLPELFLNGPWTKNFEDKQEFSFFIHLPTELLLHSINIVLAMPIASVPKHIHLDTGLSQQFLLPSIIFSPSYSSHTTLQFSSNVVAKYIKLTFGKPVMGPTLSLARISIFGEINHILNFDLIPLSSTFFLDLLTICSRVAPEHSFNVLSNLGIEKTALIEKIYNIWINYSHTSSKEILMLFSQTNSEFATLLFQKLISQKFNFSINQNILNGILIEEICKLYPFFKFQLLSYIFEKLGKEINDEFSLLLNTLSNVLSFQQGDSINLSMTQLVSLFQLIVSQSEGLIFENLTKLLCQLCKENINNFQNLLSLFSSKEYSFQSKLICLGYVSLDDKVAPLLLCSSLFKEIFSQLESFVSSETNNFKLELPEQKETFLVILKFFATISHHWIVKNWISSSSFIPMLLRYYYHISSQNEGEYNIVSELILQILLICSNLHPNNQRILASCLLNLFDNLPIETLLSCKKALNTLLIRQETMYLAIPTNAISEKVEKEIYFPSSKLVTSFQQGKLLNSYVNSTMPELGQQIYWKCLWSLENTNGKWGDFEAKCFEQGPLFFIIRTSSGEIIGGFCCESLKANLSGKSFGGDKCFLFNLNKKTLFKPVAKEAQMLIEWRPPQSCFISWTGNITDLHFTLDNEIRCFARTNNFLCLEQPSSVLLTEYEFDPIDVEVWGIEKNLKRENVSFERDLLSPWKFQTSLPLYHVAFTTPLHQMESELFKNRYQIFHSNLDSTNMDLTRANFYLSSFVEYLQAKNEHPIGSELLYCKLKENEIGTTNSLEDTTVNKPPPILTYISPFYHSFAEGKGLLKLISLIEYSIKLDNSNEEAKNNQKEMLLYWLAQLKNFSTLFGFEEMFLAWNECCQILITAIQERKLSESEDGPTNTNFHILFEVIEKILNGKPNPEKIKLCVQILEKQIFVAILERLGTICNISPRGAFMKSYSSPPTPSTSTKESSPSRRDISQKKAKKRKKYYWEKGTGFGYGNTMNISEWNQEEFEKQRIKVAQQVCVLFRIVIHFVEIQEFPTNETSTDWKTQIFQLLESSSFIPILESYLRNDSFLEIVKEIEVYETIMTVLESLVKFLPFATLLDKLPDQSTSLYDLLKHLDQQAQQLIDRLSLVPVAEQGIEATQILLAAKLITQSYKRIAEFKKLMSGNDGQLEEAPIFESPLELYCHKLKDHQFGTISMIDPTTKVYKHHYAEMISKQSSSNSEKILRLAQEFGTLSSSLPLSLDSSIFVRIDEERLDVMKVLIVGPTGGPYAGGCFIFDIFFPNNYPKAPPLVNLETTGSGSVRFNPNLYANGKVCLSLLGTWTGGKDEMWNPESSTILQVLVSIQSLILVPEPYFNEPGYEKSRGTTEGRESSTSYNEVIRVATIQHAMVGHLQTPPLGFEKVVHLHFYLKKQELISQCEQWLEEAKPHKSHYERLLVQVNLLKQELEKLKEADFDEHQDLEKMDEGKEEQK